MTQSFIPRLSVPYFYLHLRVWTREKFPFYLTIPEKKSIMHFVVGGGKELFYACSWRWWRLSGPFLSFRLSGLSPLGLVGVWKKWYVSRIESLPPLCLHCQALKEVVITSWHQPGLEVVTSNRAVTTKTKGNMCKCCCCTWVSWVLFGMDGNSPFYFTLSPFPVY